jgi:hypothetical protein
MLIFQINTESNFYILNAKFENLVVFINKHKPLVNPLLAMFYTRCLTISFFLDSFQLFKLNAIKIPTTTNTISPIAYFKYLPVLFFS